MSFCFVIQPFDGGGEFDKRYDDIIQPAISALNIEPYRVDRDHSANNLIEAIQEKIAASTLCLADISDKNPNVWYEIGYAIALKKEVVFICSEETKSFPFDIRHLNIISYKKGAPSDFKKLKEDISNRITAILQKERAIENIQASPVKETLGLSEREIIILASIMGNRTAHNDAVADFTISDDVLRTGSTKLASNLGLLKLLQKDMIEKRAWLIDDNFNSYQASGYALTKAGEDWLINNEDKLQLKIKVKPSRDEFDDDVPF